VPEAPDLGDEARAALVRAGYDAIAEGYLRLAGDAPPTHPRNERTAAVLATLPDGARVLELGCGAGIPVAEEVLRRGHSYVGVDVSPRQIDLATRHVPGGDFRLGDLLDQRFPAGGFDAVFALYVLTHVLRERWHEVFARLHLWLRPGGVVLLNVPPEDSAGWLEEDFLGLGGTSWTNAYGARRTVELLEARGFTIVDARSLVDDDPGADRWVWITAATLPQ
jgi:cyclopropane fatty-acyl-phospholipid synthase-like methyltransferase